MTEPYKEFEAHGLTVKIYPDDDPQSPDDRGDDNLFLVGFHRDFTVERKGYGKDTTIEALEKGLEGYHVLPLEAYIHGGVMLYLSGGATVDRQWDVSQLGAVFVSKKEAKTKAQARKLALGLIEEWNNYLSGNVWGYKVEDKDGNELDSCWGFNGDIEYCEEEARSTAKWQAKALLKKHVSKKKAEIRNRVPLDKRSHD